MDFVGAFLGVLAIIGIIVVGGFVIFFLGDLVLSVLDPNYSRFGKGKKKDNESNSKENEIKQIEAPKEEAKEISYRPFVVEDKETENKQKENVIEQGISDDFFDSPQQAKKEEDIEIEKSDNIDILRAEEEKFKEDMLKAIEERRAKRSAEPSKVDDVDFDKFFFDDDDIDVFDDENQEVIEGQENINDIISEDEDNIFEDLETLEKSEEVVENEEIIESDKNVFSEDAESEDAEEEINNKKVEEVESEETNERYKEEISKLESENLAIKKEKEELEQERNKAKEEIARLLAEKTNLSKNLEEVTDKKVKSKGSLSIEEYEEQLSKLTQRLSENEKDFRRVKKDFIPLRKVKKTLENDEKKLRRREAIVAKKKVELYGVNNIGDIDQEKAQKLTQDLDLLEGLKLSVKHCEEVMQENKDRYPILEKTYDILFNTNKSLKSDIEEIQEKINKLKETEDK